MEITRDWWHNYRHDFDLYISSVVLDEVARGDTEIAKKRLERVKNFLLLDITESVDELALEFMTKSNLPPKASDDAVHIAVATIHRMDYLLTWNCRHIANGHIQKKPREICLNLGYKLPIICTPYELIGE